MSLFKNTDMKFCSEVLDSSTWEALGTKMRWFLLLMLPTNRNISNYSVMSYIVVAMQSTFLFSSTSQYTYTWGYVSFIIPGWLGRHLVVILMWILTSKLNDKCCLSACQTCTGHCYVPGTSPIHRISSFNPHISLWVTCWPINSMEDGN